MNRIFLLLLFVPGICRAQYITTVAGNGGSGFNITSGLAIASTIYQPDGVAVDAAGNIYFSDGAGDVVFKVSAAGAITRFAGNGSAGSAGDGGPATDAQLYGPAGLCVDASGNLYIADFWNNLVRKVSPSGIISTVAGCCGFGYPGYGGDGGPATLAQLNTPSGVAVDASGNIYIADNSNNCVRKVTPAGIISTFAGTGMTGGSLGDGGPATDAEIYGPDDVEVDAAGNVYITDEGNYRIRKVDPAGMITSIAGTTVGFSGDGGPATLAQLNNPHGITLDGSGNIYFTEEVNNRIRKIAPSGIISTIAGTGATGWGAGGYNGDGIAATTAKLNLPYNIAADGAGNLFVSDAFNNRVRKIVMSAAPCSGAPPSSSPLSTPISACDTLRSLLFLPAAPILTGLHYQWQSSPDSSAWSNITTATNITWPDTITSTRYYRCILTCTSTSSPTTTPGIKLTVHPHADAGSISGIDTVCPGHTITLTNTATAGTWSAGNAHATVVGGLVTGVTPGPVAIRYIVTNTCSADTATFNITVSSAGSCTGGITEAYQQYLRIFPNPCAGMLSVTAPEPITQLTILSPQGKTEFDQSSSNKNITIDISHLPNGLHFINVNGHVTKLIKTQ